LTPPTRGSSTRSTRPSFSRSSTRFPTAFSTGFRETLTRARALTLLGGALSGLRDASGGVDQAALREAAETLRRAKQLQLQLGNRPAASTVCLLHAMWHEMLSGRAENALALLDEGIELAAGNPRRRAQLRYARARVLGELGRFEEVDAAIDEVAETARRWGDGWLNGYLAWERMRLASWRADADGVRRHLAAVPEIVERDGERLVLGSGAHSDLSAFMADASTALHRAQNDAVAAAQLAGAVIDRYRGSLLPFDRYEPWTIALRERALAAMLAPDRWRGARRDTGGTARCRHVTRL
jgi:tetratricopeptide (TPR) repeat protein